MEGGHKRLPPSPTPVSPNQKWYLKNRGRGSQSSEFRVLGVEALRLDCSREENMEMQKPTLWEIKRVQRALDFEEYDDLTDRDIWIAREFLDE